MSTLDIMTPIIMKTAYVVIMMWAFTPSIPLRILLGLSISIVTKFLETKDKRYWWQLIQLLPSSYNQKRTVMLNYEVLANIYRWRKDHKLDEWRNFCKWIKYLPYAKELIINDEKSI